MPNTNREDRIGLINQIQEKRGSTVISYLTSDRIGINAQIGGDVIRPMYDHLRSLGFNGVQKIDLFLYSRGGAVDVPWPFITMFREYCKELNVLIPFRAHSAATLIALGADHIVMGKKGELGPIDPQFTKQQNGQTEFSETMGIEDIMSFVAFIKEKVGLGDQAAISQQVSYLTDKLTPWTLGSIYRTHSHIRIIARKLLSAHSDSIDERKIESIIETLAEKTYFHGHSIGWSEAEAIGLPIEKASEEIDDAMWKLFQKYEDLLELNIPIDPKSIIPPNQDNFELEPIFAITESTAFTKAYTGTLMFNRVRQTPQQLNFNFNVNFPLPPNITAEQIPPALNQIIGQQIQNFQEQASQIVRNELNRQAPTIRVEGGLYNGSWKDITSEGY